MQENKIIALALFVMSILIVQSFYTYPNVYALTIEVVSFGATGQFSPLQDRDCKYNTSTNVWCPTTTGAKIWNPTTRTVSATVYSGIAISDVECNSIYCFTWHLTSSDNIGNLTMFLRTGGSVIDSYLFDLGTGGIAGHGIGLVTSTETNGTTIFTLVEGQTCLDGVTPLGNTDEKGICFIGVSAGESFPLDGTRFISDGATSDTDVNYDIIWNGDLAEIGSPTANRVVVKHRDLSGNFQYYNINVASSGTTFATAQVCNSGTVSGGLTSQNKLFQFNGIIYDGVNNDLWTMDSTNSSCAETQKANLIDETIITGVNYSTNDNLFFITSSTDGAVETNSLNVYNGTTFGASTLFDRVLKINLTSTANNFVWTPIVHQAEGEIHVWRGSDMVIISELLTPSGESPTEEFCSLPENANILICRLESSPPLTGASELLNQSSTNIVCMIGLLECTQDAEGNFTPSNPDIKTNGVGYLITIIMFGILISIFWLASGGRLGDIPTFVWFIATLAVLGVMVGFDFLDVTFLLIGIIAIIALAVAKAKGLFGDVGLFKGE